MIALSNDVLTSAINKIIGIVDRRSSRPILSNCLFQLENEVLHLYATDLEVSAKISINVIAKTKASFCVNLKQLSDILKELPSGEIILNFDQANNFLHLKMIDSDFSIVSADAKEFPLLNFEHSDFKIKFSPQEVINIVDKVSYAMSLDETRIFLNGIYIHQQDNHLKAVAIDGHRLALMNLMEHNYPEKIFEAGILIPRKGVTELRRMAQDALQNNEAIELYVDQNHLTVVQKNDTISIRLISREYPKYQTVIPSKCNLQVKTKKEPFLAAVKRVRLLSNEQTQGIKLNFKNDFMELSSSHSILGKAFEKIRVEYNGQETEISLNGRYLIDALTAMDAEEINLEFNNSQSPIVLKTKSQPNYISIIMPLRL